MHQVSPELLREDLAKHGKERDRLFDVWFQLEKLRQEKLDMHGLETSWYVEAKEVTRFELSMGLGELEAGGMIGKIEYDDRIFSAQTIAQIHEDYLSMLRLMVAEPEKNLATISLANTAAVASVEL